MSSQPVHIVSSLCRLSATSQLCLNHICGTTQIQMQLIKPETAAGPGAVNSFGAAAPAAAAAAAAVEIPCSRQVAEPPQSNEHEAISNSRNTSFMINLMGMCNKMILPLAELHQDCASCQAQELALPPPLEDSNRWGSGEPPPTALQSNDDFMALMAAMRQTNQHKPTERCCGGCDGYGDHLSNPRLSNLNNANSSDGVPSQTVVEHTSPRPQQQYIASTKSQTSVASPSANLAVKEAPAGAVTNKPALAAANAGEANRCRVQRTPSTAVTHLLLPSHGLVLWNLTEFQEFRTMERTHQVFEPMLDPGRHRHMIIEDCHRRLRNAINGFHTPYYRPY